MFKLIGEAKGVFNVITILELVISIIFVMLGLTFFTNPSGNDTFVAVITGLLLMAYGGLSIYSYMKKGGIELFNFNMIFGVLLILFGFLIMILSNYITYMLGIYFIIIGAQKIIYGTFLKKFNESSWLIILVSGLLFIVEAVVMMVVEPDSIIKLAGICLLGFGLINAVNTILLRKRSKYFIA